MLRWERFQINMLIKASCANLSESLREPEAHLTESEILKLNVKNMVTSCSFIWKSMPDKCSLFSLMKMNTWYTQHEKKDSWCSCKSTEHLVGCYARCYWRYWDRLGCLFCYNLAGTIPIESWNKSTERWSILANIKARATFRFFCLF